MIDDAPTQMPQSPASGFATTTCSTLSSVLVPRVASSKGLAGSSTKGWKVSPDGERRIRSMSLSSRRSAALFMNASSQDRVTFSSGAPAGTVMV